MCAVMPGDRLSQGHPGDVPPHKEDDITSGWQDVVREGKNRGVDDREIPREAVRSESVTSKRSSHFTKMAKFIKEDEQDKEDDTCEEECCRGSQSAKILQDRNRKARANQTGNADLETRISKHGSG